MMQIIKKGETYQNPLEPIPPSGGARLVFTPAGLEILFMVPGPSEYERNAFLAGHETKIGLAISGRLGIIIVNFKCGFSFEVPFDAGLGLKENVPELNFDTENSRIAVTFVAIDIADQNRVFGLKLITMSTRVSRYLAQQITKQLATPTTLAAYDADIKNMYFRYPATKDVEKAALAYDKAGTD